MRMLSSTSEKAETSAIGLPSAPMNAFCETHAERRLNPTGRAFLSAVRNVRKLAVSLTE